MSMKHAGLLAVAAAMTLMPPPPVDARQADARAAEVVANARKALGGDGTLAGVKALSLRASYRRELAAPTEGAGQQMIVIGPGGGGATQWTGDIEIDAVFPDKYIKVDTQTGMAAITRTDGFDGDRPLVSVQSHSPHVRIREDSPASDPVRTRAAVERARAELARLLLGMIAGTQPGFTTTYSYAGRAESPDGQAEVVDVQGPDGFAARLFVDAETHLPLMLTYVAPEPRLIVRTMRRPEGGTGAGKEKARGGAPPPAEMTPEERERLDEERLTAGATPPKMIENRLFFSDYRRVDGLLLPHRIVRGTAAAITEEWDIKTYEVNPSIKADRFTVS